MTETQEQSKVSPNTDPIKFTFNVLRNRRSENDFTVTFIVKDESQKNFSAIIQNFLKELPKNSKITLKTADDSVTHKPVRYFIEVESYGIQQQVAGRLQQYTSILNPYCLDIK